MDARVTELVEYFTNRMENDDLKELWNSFCDSGDEIYSMDDIDDCFIDTSIKTVIQMTTNTVNFNLDDKYFCCDYALNSAFSGDIVADIIEAQHSQNILSLAEWLIDREPIILNQPKFKAVCEIIYPYGLKQKNDSIYYITALSRYKVLKAVDIQENGSVNHANNTGEKAGRHLYIIVDDKTEKVVNYFYTFEVPKTKDDLESIIEGYVSFYEENEVLKQEVK